MVDNRNLLLAVVLSIVILLGFETFFGRNRPAPEQTPTTAQTETQPGQKGAPEVPATPARPQVSPSKSVAAPEVPAIPGTGPTPGPSATREAILAQSPRVKIATPRINGTVVLIGGRFDDLTLTDYREALDAKSPPIDLLLPKGMANAYFAEFGWVGDGSQPLPSAETRWQADRDTLAPDRPVTLTWDNGKGLKFTRTLAVDRDYMFTITQRVENTGDGPVTLYPYGLVSRRGTPEVTGFYILHEGLLGVHGGTLEETSYEDIREKRQVKKTATGGWVGITDKYWLTALVPDQKAEINSRFSHRKDEGDDVYQVDYLSAPITVQPGASGTAEGRFFAGAKEVTVIDGYNDALGIDRFDLAIDFGWFYFLTKPIFYALLYINHGIGNFGISIILLTIAIKLVFFPLANKSYTSMSKMKKLQPEMVKLRERYADDKMKLNEEMMALYKREKVNPASGCLPILIQIPVFFALYKVLFVNIEMRHAPFFGWIKDLSVADPTTVFNLFGLIPWMPPDFLHIGAWPLIMGISMYLQQKLNPQPTDPIQAKIFLFLPILFTFLLAKFPAGLVIYWAVNNVLSMAQQWVIMRRMGITGKEALR